MSHITKYNILLIFLTFITIFQFSCSKNTVTITERVDSNGKIFSIKVDEESEIELHKSYYPNGKLEYEAEMRQGIPDGIAKYWGEEGNLLNITNYENGKLHGNSIRYFENGNISSKIEYFYGEIHGVSETYHENGKIKSHQKFEYGEPISELLRFDNFGKRIYQP